ncbi:MAG: sigma-70 family RNA polymerase sigma factor [Planctomycetes bacterium]|nr:sigma-70 family RNA polymerase sigma factor [Planctomycetota bacterium]
MNEQDNSDPRPRTSAPSNPERERRKILVFESLEPLDPPGPALTEDLLRRHRDGDRGASDELCRRYLDRLRCYVRVRRGSRRGLDTDEVVQDAYAKMLPRLVDFDYRGKDSVYAYLCAVADNFIGRGARSTAMRRIERDDTEGTLLADALGREAAPDANASDAELERILEETLRALSPRYQNILLERHLLGGSSSEVAARLGLAGASLVDTLYSRARAAWVREAEPQLRAWIDRA